MCKVTNINQFIGKQVSLFDMMAKPSCITYDQVMQNMPDILTQFEIVLSPTVVQFDKVTTVYGIRFVFTSLRIYTVESLEQLSDAICATYQLHKPQ